MSKIEVDAIDKQSGSTLTLGGSGTAVTLAAGATQSGFGRTGTVDWQTSIKTASSFTAVNGEGYFVDTSSNAVTANLPAGSVGAIVSFKDYAQNFDTNALTISADGSEKIEGQTFDLAISAEGAAVTLVYGDATKGWQAVNSNEITNTAKFVSATGGTISTSGDFKIHTFTGPGSFCVSCAGNPAGSSTVSYVVVAGGGGGGSAAGAGGAGGYRESRASDDSYTASPLNATSGPTFNLPVSASSFPITVGGGGAGGAAGADNSGVNGSNSIFSSITSAGGGGGGSYGPAAGAGGSGGGVGPSSCGTTGGAGNTPPVSPAQGNKGGDHTASTPQPYYSGTGGGGATAAGVDTSAASTASAGGAGATSCITASPVIRAGGGGGSTLRNPGGTAGGTAGAGGSGGGGAGKNGSSSPYVGNPGTVNTGGGGGAGSGGCFGSGGRGGGGTGGSGIVIIRYKFK